MVIIDDLGPEIGYHSLSRRQGNCINTAPAFRLFADLWRSHPPRVIFLSVT
mgnify:FL=1